MEQTKALNALEPFLALSKSATSPRAASDLVVQATSAPNTYVFAELLQTPNIQSLRSSPEHASYLTLLEVFAWGTWADYKTHAGLPKLSAPQHQKLLLLSLLPLSHAHATLTYARLQAALDLPTPRALEELITTAIYAGLLTATLDPAHSRVSVTSIAPLRDLAPGALPRLQSTLAAWSGRCDAALADLDAQVERVKRDAVQREKLRRKRERAVEVQTSDERGAGKRAPEMRGGGYGDDDAMDIDQEGGSGRATRGAKKGAAPSGLGGAGRRLGQ
ncbi:COP9 signalosome subunit 7 [Didymella exigua CBS 183.55]|uniref:COP9 signalosome subunit 7 n=1 Tax=Didymella exigua CBS 183.55 TaxID=1150837 RepID=A0A6A5RF03_9PLEO|nr:COP9 signalosome subunit 7 [Didymella exigua CBS 183.55]KAF1926272.1 COP9 signalosome subunit 7 [Didymella exigua CBS 183.55]